MSHSCSLRLHNGHVTEQPRRNVTNYFSDDIYDGACATFCAQLSRTDSFDVRGFDAVSDVPPTQLQRKERERKERERERE